MKFLNNDYEERTLSTREDLQEYLSFRSDHDEWLIPFCNECAAVGISNLGEIDQTNTMDTAPELIQEAMENKLLLVYPNNMIPEIKPIRYTAFPDILARAGLKGRTIEQMVDKGNIAALDPIIKGQWLSTGLSLNSNECKILIRDGKISAMKSHEYQIFKELDLVNLLEDELGKNWEDFEYVDGRVSHEFLSINYNLNCQDMEDSFRFRMQDLGVTVDEIHSGIQMSTSDVGNSSVIMAPYLILNKIKIAMGKPVYIRHDTSNSLDTILTKTQFLATSFKEAEDEIEKLGNTQISYPSDCFMNLVKEQKLPKKLAESIADRLKTLSDATAMDVYIALNELVDLHYAQGKIGLSVLLNEQEQVGRLLYINYTDFDHPCEK